MGIALIIVGGLCLMTFAASVFGYLGEKKKRTDPAVEAKVAEIERRLSELERKGSLNDERLEQIEGDVAFVNKLITDKH